jgi:hypothetical protein
LQHELQESRQDLTIVQNELTETQNELSLRSEWISPTALYELKEEWESGKSSELSEKLKIIDKLSNDNQELQAEFSSLHEEYDNLVLEEGQKKEEMAINLNELQRQYEQTVVEKEMLQQEVRQLHQDSFDLKTKLSTTQRTVEERENWISPETAHQTFETTISSLKLQLLQQLEVIETLQGTVKMKEKQLSDLRVESDEASERDERLDLSLIQLEKFKEMIQTLKDRNKELMETNETQEKVLTEKRQLILKLEEQIASASKITLNPSMKVNGSHTQQTLSADLPILFFEIGSFVTRIGLWNNDHFVPW